jgi:Golgi SNAP receptor complex protein 1
MTEYAAGGGQAANSGAAVHHTLQRHRDILQDYRQEYNKTKANIRAVIEREDLLSSVHRDIDDYRSAVGGGGKAAGRMDYLLRESESARNSERMIDEQARDLQN